MNYGLGFRPEFWHDAGAKPFTDSGKHIERNMDNEMHVGIIHVPLWV